MMHSLSIRRPKDKDRDAPDKSSSGDRSAPVSPVHSSPQKKQQPPVAHPPPPPPPASTAAARKHSISSSFKNLFIKSPRQAPVDHHQNQPTPLQISPQHATAHTVRDVSSPSSSSPSPIGVAIQTPTSATTIRSPALRPTNLESVNEESSSIDQMVIEKPQDAYIPKKHRNVPSPVPALHPVTSQQYEKPPSSKVDSIRRGSLPEKKGIPCTEEGSIRIYEDGTHEHYIKPIKPQKIPQNTGVLSGFFRKSSTRVDGGDAAFSMLPERNRMDFQRRLSIQSRKTTDSLNTEEYEDEDDSECQTDSEDEEYTREAVIGDAQLQLINKLVEAIDKEEDQPASKDLEEKTTRGYKLTEKYGKPLGIVGKGAYGTVKLVSRIDNATKKEVFYAVKELRRKDNETKSHFSQRLTSEFVISNSLEHINIAKTIDLMHSAAGVYSEIIEYCSGGDLYTHIAQTKREGLHPVEADCFMKQVLRGIAHCHSRGVAHCDIKPENILLTSSGVAKLADFGTAAVFRTAWEKEVHYSSGACGSEPYVAPEEFTEKEYDPRGVDVWAAGVLYLTMVTGTYLWPVAKVGEDLYDDYISERPTQRGKSGSFTPIEILRSGTENNRSRKGTLYAMLDPNPHTRLTVQQALKSSWVQGIRVCEAADIGS